MKQQNERGIFVVTDFVIFIVFQVVLTWKHNGGWYRC